MECECEKEKKKFYKYGKLLCQVLLGVIFLKAASVVVPGLFMLKQSGLL
jgi:hypothetical protein